MDSCSIFGNFNFDPSCNLEANSNCYESYQSSPEMKNTIVSLCPRIKKYQYRKIITFKYDVEIWVKFFSKPDSKYLYHHSLFCQGKRIVLLFNDWLVAGGGTSSLHCEEFRHCLMISNSTSLVRTFPKHTYLIDNGRNKM